MKLWIILFRTSFFYFFIVIMYRLMGKREVGQLGVIDLIVSILVSELMAISIENTNEPMILTISPILLLALLEILLAFISIKSRTFRNIFAGKPSNIIKKGKINYKEMIKQRYSLDDLLLHLRQEGIKSIDEVEYAILETNGKLSIFKYNFFKTNSTYPMPVIVDGIIQNHILSEMNKSTLWLRHILKSKELTPDDVFYAFYKGKKLFVIKKIDIK